MQFGELFYEWTAGRVLRVIGMVVLVAVAVFFWLNVATGPGREVGGMVVRLGMESGTKMSFPERIATIDTEEGARVLVVVPRSMAISEGTGVVVRERGRALTDGYQYELVRLEE